MIQKITIKKYHEKIQYAKSLGLTHAQAVLAKSKTKAEILRLAIEKCV